MSKVTCRPISESLLGHSFGGGAERQSVEDVITTSELGGR